MSDEERLARVALSRIAEPGDPRLTGLVQERGGGWVLERLRSDTEGTDLHDRLRSTEPHRVLEDAAKRNLRFVTPGDDEWPSQLDGLAHAPLLHQRGGVPVGLWCRGPLRLDEATQRAVAIVGSRSGTTYGTGVAADIAGGLARESWTVISGAAYGIDQAAHRGALAHEGATVAVLACGADRAYPTGHRALIDYIAEVGLVVSEAAPGCAPTRIRFLARNRLIAGLARGTVVVEAAIRSGALNTASWADGLGRPVMGVPGAVTSETSAGVHQLIRTRGAMLVTRPEEVLEVVAAVGEFALADLREPSLPRDQLRLEHRQVLDAVPLRRAADLRAIARTAGMAPPRVQAALVELASRGFVEHNLGRWRVAEPTLPI